MENDVNNEEGYANISMSYTNQGSETISVSASNFSNSEYDNISDFLKLTEALLVACGFCIGERALKLVDWSDIEPSYIVNNCFQDDVEYYSDIYCSEDFDEYEYDDYDDDGCINNINPIVALYDGKKVKRRGWKGFWYYHNNLKEIIMHTYDEKNKEFIDIPLRKTDDLLCTLDNLTKGDWFIVE